jgi:hypothetical protein
VHRCRRIHLPQSHRPQSTRSASCTRPAASSCLQLYAGQWAVWQCTPRSHNRRRQPVHSNRTDLRTPASRRWTAADLTAPPTRGACRVECHSPDSSSLPRLDAEPPQQHRPRPESAPPMLRSAHLAAARAAAAAFALSPPPSARACAPAARDSACWPVALVSWLVPRLRAAPAEKEDLLLDVWWSVGRSWCSLVLLGAVDASLDRHRRAGRPPRINGHAGSLGRGLAPAYFRTDGWMDVERGLTKRHISDAIDDYRDMHLTIHILK